MNKEIAQRWVDALRSGAYEQTDGALQDEDGFCCLGVLCDIAVKEGVIPEPEGYPEGPMTYGIGLDTAVSLPPASVEAWSGLDSERVFRIDDGEIGEETLYHLNDIHGFSFDDIADVIEKEYLK